MPLKRTYVRVYLVTSLVATNADAVDLYSHGRMFTATRSLRLGGRRVPVVFPNLGDARLHTALVIVSIHVIGITALGFEVSVPQIVAAMLTAGVIDVFLTFRQTGRLVWPASGMLTGSGVALILRLVGMDSGNYWSFDGWHWFALVAGVSILTKYYVRFRGRHIFNPSNIGLVGGFLIIGSGIIEPLDFWWAPPGPWMLVAYAVIVGGGVLITRRLHLLEMATVFWVVLAAGLGVLAASGHCMTATWSPTPVCGQRFWTILVTSPEILIFLLFMITDPKTIPEGRAARVVFAATLGAFTTLMIAPHSVEYGAKVGLLASLAVWSPLRGLFDRMLPVVNQTGSGLGDLLDRGGSATPVALFARGVMGGAAIVVLAVGIVLAGGPARDMAVAAEFSQIEVDVQVDAAALPHPTVDSSVEGLAIDVDDEFVDMITRTLAENLAVEAEAIRTADGRLLGVADGGRRLDEMQARMDEVIATGERRADHYLFDSLALSLHESEGGQSSAGLVFAGEGTIRHVLYGASGEQVGTETESFRSNFVLRQLGERWLLVSVEPESDETAR